MKHCGGNTAFEKHKTTPEDPGECLLKSEVKTKKRTLYVMLLKTKKHNLLFLVVLLIGVPGDQ